MNQKIIFDDDRIAAIATPAGKGGVGVIRISGSSLEDISLKLLGFLPAPRKATFCSFKNGEEIVDQGIALYFKAPSSFTGEDILELQCHGGPVLLDYLLGVVLKTGVRLARPGEFSERAFLNNKIDLIQAEAISDLINAQSICAVRSSMKSLRGEFSDCINDLVRQLIYLRTLVESCIDFPEEDIDPLYSVDINEKVKILLDSTRVLEKKASQGVLLQEGLRIVITGEPNVGKSTLLNTLVGDEIAIVTNVAGTTRDIIRGTVDIDGVILHISDTAGLRETVDVVEKEGIKRAYKEIKEADLIFLVIDRNNVNDEISKIRNENTNSPIVVIVNKIDLKKIEYKKDEDTVDVIYLSAKSGEGVDNLKKFLKNFIGFYPNQEGVFIARRRHLEALAQVSTTLERAADLLCKNGTLELVAEELRLAQVSCNTITGVVTADDLLGNIFSTFCLGK